MKKSLIWALALLLALPALAMGEEAPAPLVKDETVYAMLDASGAAQNVLVVSRIETPEEGRYVDYGAYEQIAAMVSGVTPVVEGETIAWELPADEAGFYSVGTPSEAELPVTLEVVYALDGETVAPDALAGQSGRVSITMTVRPNENALQVYRDHYMAQIQLPLSMDTCANIDAPGRVRRAGGPDEHAIVHGASRTGSDLYRCFRRAEFLPERNYDGLRQSGPGRHDGPGRG